MAGVFTDFDGTLAPIVRDPAAAKPARGVAELLDGLAQRYGVGPSCLAGQSPFSLPFSRLRSCCRDCTASRCSVTANVASTALPLAGGRS